MDKVKISEIDRVHIKNFLKDGGKKIDKDWAVEAAILNIVVLGASLYFFEYSFTFKIILVMIEIVIILSLVYFLKKICICIMVYTQVFGL